RGLLLLRTIFKRGERGSNQEEYYLAFVFLCVKFFAFTENSELRTFFKRGEWDSNPRRACTLTHFPGERHSPPGAFSEELLSGESGIRTRDGVAPVLAFQASALGHYATSPSIEEFSL